MVRKRNTLAGLLVVGLVLTACGLLAAPEPHPGSAGDSRQNIVTPVPTDRPPAGDATPVIALPVIDPWEKPLRLENLDAVPPEDVIQSLYVFGAGGGPDDCLAPPEENILLEARQPDVIVLQYCWEDADTSVALTVASPDRGEEVFVLPVKDAGGFRYVDGFYQVDLTRQAGKYTFHLDGSQRAVTFSANFSPPKLPVIYLVYPPGSSWQYGVVGPRHRLHLAGFAPDEALRLLVYRKDYPNSKLEFLGWQPVSAGKDGQAWLEVDFGVGADDDLGLSVVGALSGEVHVLEQGNERYDSMLAFHAVCPGTLFPRLRGNTFVRVLHDTSLYRKYSRTSQVDGSLKAGARIQILDGPFCVDGGVWWFGIAPDGLVGYVLEADGGQYLLEPAP